MGFEITRTGRLMKFRDAVKKEPRECSSKIEYK
jgi:hypothetical protein